jgi:peptide/nickel transport system substrate-binding protein
LASAGALGALGSLWLVTGCASAVGEAANAQSAAASSGPVKGGTIKAGISQDLIPGNFFTNSTSGITTVVGLAFDSLIRYPNDKVEPTPRLATSWEPSADGLSLTLKLRDGVTFHDGRAFTSADVAFSIATYASPDWNGQLRSTAAAITSVDSSDPKTAVLHFEHPLGNIFDLLDTIPIVDSGSLDKLKTGEAFVGTGPFKLTEWVPNSKLTFVKNPNYWQSDRPYVDGVDVTIISDAKALLAAVKAGQIDFANGLSNRDIETLTADGKFNAIVLEGAEQQLYVGANVSVPGLQDVPIRQAIAYAVDRDRIVTEVLRSVGYSINLPWPKYSLAYDEAANKTYARNVDKAKQLVAGLGAIPTFPLTYIAGNPLAEATATIVQANLAEVGITVTLDPQDNAQFVKQLIGAQFPGLWVTIHSWAQYTPSTLTVSAYPFNAHKNASQYNSPDYIKFADAAWTQQDGSSAAAVTAYEQVSQQLLDSLFLVEIAILLPQFTTSPRLQAVGHTKRAEVQFTDAYLA